MSYTTLSLPAFKVIGIAHTTTNRNKQSYTDIPKFWNSYISNSIEDQIPNKIQPLHRIGLYTNYKLDKYTVIIGACVSSLSKVPKELTAQEIPAGKYAVFTVNGPLETAVAKTWEHIMSLSNLPRAYTNDFEIYEYNDANNLQATRILISLI